MNITIQYVPNAKQSLFHASDATEVVYGGAKGGGKSCGLVMECLAYGLENPGAEMYIFRETYDDLEANIIREWKEKVPKELYSYHESKHIATLLNGTSVKFRYIRNFTDAEGYQGRSMDWIGVDELTKHEERSIQVLMSCLRSPKGFKPRFRGTCNPGGIGHTWVKEEYLEATAYGAHIATCSVTGNTRAFIAAKVYDNTVLMANDPGYAKRLENLPEAEKKAFLYGDWDIFEGQYFPEYKRDVHVIEPFEIPDHWERFRSMDYGLDMCSVGWWATDTEGTLYRYRELHEPNLNLTQAVKRVLEMTAHDEKISYTVASPDLWNRRQETGVAGQEIMYNAGLKDLVRANDSRVPGWRLLREYLTPYERKDADNGAAYITARMKFFNTCSHAIRCIPQLQHDTIKPEDASKDPHEITHTPEECRYMVMSRPRLSKDPMKEMSTIGRHKQQLARKLSRQQAFR